MAELAAYPTPVSSFRLKSLSKLQNIFTHRYFSSDTFFLLANQSLDPSLQKIASDYIVHYDYDEVDCALSPWSSLSIKISEFEEEKMWFSGPGQCDKQQGGDGRGQDDARLLQQEDVHQQVRGVEHAHHEGQSL